MIVKRLNRLVLLGLIVCLTTLFWAAPASAAKSDEFADLRAWFEEYHVPSSVVQDLIDKLEAGQGWDSFSEDPEIVSQSISTDHGFEEIVQRYVDGSITVMSLGGQLSAMDGLQYANTYHGCARSEAGGGWTNYYECTVGATNGILEMVFFADYFRSTGGGGIYSAYSPYAYATAGTAATPSLNIVRTTSTASLPAEVHAQTQFVPQNQGQSFTGHLYLRVSASSAWVATAGF